MGRPFAKNVCYKGGSVLQRVLHPLGISQAPAARAVRHTRSRFTDGRQKTAIVTDASADAGISLTLRGFILELDGIPISYDTPEG